MENMSSKDSILEVNNLKTYFYHEEGIVRAVDDISFDIKKGETVGIVGESGCGKSVTSLSIMRLVPQPRGKIEGGEIYFKNKDSEIIDLISLDPKGKEIRKIRGNEIAMIFQEPMTSLTPVYTVGDQIMEALKLHQNMNNNQAREKTVQLLDLVGIGSPEQRVDDYPHSLSGGQRQRVMIAMALSCNPNLLIADEPTTALDVTIEAQILDLMDDLQDEFNMSIMFITHDLEVIGEMAERVVVMYTGTIVEKATIDDIFYNQKHPYTSGLLNSIPKIGIRKRLTPITGSVPDLKHLPEGCYFEPRCPEAMDICRSQRPPQFSIKKDQTAKCWLYQEKSKKKSRI